jgi:mRNA-degrading endonuclease RelE of RelBE toxin-antitoxin system
MVFIETSVFTRQILNLVSEDEYRELQTFLAARPDAGPIIRGTAGLRKLRWSSESRGKSGGIRVIYYWVVAEDRILFLLMYRKGEQDDLTPAQRKILRRIVEEEYP